MTAMNALKGVAELTALEECVDLRSGKTPSRSRMDFWSGTIPWFSAKDLKSVHLRDSEEHISDAAVAAGAPIASAGDILMLVRGMTLMKNVPVGVLTRDASFNQDLKSLRPVDGISSAYLGYMLAASRPRLMAMVDKAGHGTGRLAVERLLSLPIWKPSLKMQKFVETLLQRHDEVIQIYQDLVDAKRNHKRALTQQLLTGQKRFSEFKGHKWDEVYLGEVFNERNESNRPDLPLLSITGDRGVIPRNEVDKRDTSNPDKSKYKRVAIGDIAYNTMRMWQGVSALSSLEGIVSPAYTVAIPTDRILGPFAKNLFKFPPVVNLFHRHSQGLVDDTLNLKFDRFAKIKLKIPSSSAEQARIASVLDLCNAEVEMLMALQKQFEKRKRALLSRLLSGEFPVPAFS